MLKTEASRTLDACSSRFTYCEKDKTLSAEVSDFGPGPLPLNIRVRSKRTGHTVEFRGARPRRDRENDITGWEYVAPGLLLILWND